MSAAEAPDPGDVAFIAAALTPTLYGGGNVGPWARLVPCELADEVGEYLEEWEGGPSFLRWGQAEWNRLHQEHYVGCTHIRTGTPSPERKAIELLHTAAAMLVAEMRKNTHAQARDFEQDVNIVDTALAEVERRFKIEEKKS